MSSADSETSFDIATRLQSLRDLLHSNEASIIDYDRDYTQLGIKYHRMAPATRDQGLTVAQYFMVRPSDGPESNQFPSIIIKMREHNTAVRRARRALHRVDQRLDRDLRRLDTLVHEAEAILEPIFDQIEQVKLDILPLLQHDRRERAALSEPELIGFDRILAMGSPGNAQRDDFHVWAMELKEVKAAMKLRRIVEDGVDEFVSGEEDRFLVEDPHLSEEEKEDVDTEDAESQAEQEDPDMVALRQIFGEGVAVQLL